LYTEPSNAFCPSSNIESARPPMTRRVWTCVAALLAFAVLPDASDLRYRQPASRLRGALSIVSGPSRTLVAQQEEPGSPRATAPLTILQLNDVYSLLPIDGAGGLARVATLKQRLSCGGRTAFLMLAGDFLSSSVESTVFKGEQMIAALNAAGLDMATL